MTPLRLRDGVRELFALHLPASSHAARSHAVLMCNPLGQEAIRAHRLYRVLGDRLVEAGFDVLRFDYHGTGDSSGEDAAFDIDGAVTDTAVAARELLRRSGAARLSLVGLRLGANIAQLATRESGVPTSTLVLLEPLPDGDAYLRELADADARAFEAGFGRRWSWDGRVRIFNAGGRADDALGFSLDARCRAQIRAALARTREAPGACARALVMAADPSAYASWARDGSAVTVEAANSGIDWATNSAVNDAIVPRRWVERVLGILDEAGIDA